MQSYQPEMLASIGHFLMFIAIAGPSLVIALVFGLPRLADFLDSLIDGRK